MAMKQVQAEDGTPATSTTSTTAAPAPLNVTLALHEAMLGYEPSSAWIYALVPLGAMFGSLPVGLISERLGRRLVLFVMGSLCLLVWPLVIVIGKNIEFLYGARFIAGMAMGSAYVLHPMYVSEISYARERGALGMMLPLVTSTAYLLSAVADTFLHPLLALVLPGLFPSILLAAFAIMPESPLYLLNIGYNTESLKAVRWFLGQPKNPQDDCEMATSNDCEMQNLGSEDAASANMLPEEQTELTPTSQVGLCTPSAAISTCLCRPYSVLVAFLALIMRPLTGAVTMRFYMEASLNSVVLQSVIPHGQLIVGIFELAGIMLGSLSVDRIGRQPLLLISSIGSAICYALLGSYFTELSGNDPKNFLIILAALFLVYGFGFGSVPWVIAGEVIPSSQKAWASGTVGFHHWSLVSIMVYIFPILISFFSQCVIFSAFGCFSIAVIIIVCKVTIETNKKSLDEIEKELQLLHSGNDTTMRQH